MVATRHCLNCGCTWNSCSPPTIVDPPVMPCEHPQITLLQQQVGNQFYNDAKVTAGCRTALESLATTYFDGHFLRSSSCQWGKKREGGKAGRLQTSEILRHAEICEEVQPFTDYTGSGNGTLLSIFRRLSSELHSACLFVEDGSVIIPGHLEDFEKRTLYRMLVAQGNRVRVLDGHTGRLRDALAAEMKTPVTSPATTVSGGSSPTSSPPLSKRQAFEGRAAV